MNPETTQALLTVCLFAAFADGNLDESERAAVRKLAGELGDDSSDSLTREILMGRRSWETIVPALPDRNSRLLACEMARSICEADGDCTPEEDQFLDELRVRMELAAPPAVPAEAEAISLVPVPTEPAVMSQELPSNDDRIMRAAIINGALEILPGTLATMAILPLQMKLVHDIAKSHAVDLGPGNIKDFLATIGVGLTSQVLEGFARKLLGGFGRSVGGKLAGGLASQAAGSAMSFASTYVIGNVADRYYAGGQKLSLPEIKSFASELNQNAKALYTTKLPQIQEATKTINPTALLAQLRGK